MTWCCESGGPNINDEMSDEPYTQQAIQDALAWLYAPQARSPEPPKSERFWTAEIADLRRQLDQCRSPEPLTEEQMAKGHHYNCDWREFVHGVRFAEAAHGILQPSQGESK